MDAPNPAPPPARNTRSRWLVVGLVAACLILTPLLLFLWRTGPVPVCEHLLTLGEASPADQPEIGRLLQAPLGSQAAPPMDTAEDLCLWRMGALRETAGAIEYRKQASCIGFAKDARQARECLRAK